MWSRKDLKTRGKNLVYGNYWYMVLVSFIMLFLGGAGSGSSSGSNSARNSANGDSSLSSIDWALLATMMVLIILIVVAALVIGSVIKIFLCDPLLVGCQRFILNAREGRRQFSDVASIFNDNYMNVVKVMFFRYLKTFLWSLLFIIPGIIKSYEYRMIPYILSENPNIDKDRAFELTKAMTNGEKWNIFVYDLSFILWSLGTLFTCGLLGIFWVNPYINATNAELYMELREQAMRSNYTNESELYGYHYKPMM